MSHYINSFLIEPVVRQARRFSRPSNNDDTPVHSVDHQHLFQHDTQVQPQRGTTEAEAAWPENTWRSTPYTTQIATTGSEAPPTSSQDPELIAEIRTWRSAHPPSDPSLANDSTLALQTDTAPSDDQVSSNPVYGIPESLRSTTSSLRDSANLAHPNSTDAQGSTRSTLQDPRGTNSSTSLNSDGTLPADDGMGSMRKRIVAIQRTDSSSIEKAKLVHQLMTEQYSSSQSSLYAPHLSPARTPESPGSHEGPITPSSGHSADYSVTRTSPPTSSSSVANTNNPFKVSLKDLRPTFFPKPIFPHSIVDSKTRSSDRIPQHSNEEVKAFGCSHYKRNIKLQCSSCCRWYTCRFCHDEAENHALNRRETKNMLCMFCGCPQPAAGECAQCGERSARYYCSVCKLWDDDPGKRIYHCHDCGICRIGEGLGKDFFHCKTCCACLSIRTWDNHRCIERSTDCDCPICGEYMFTSPQTVVFMRCGHSIHHRCYYEYMKRSYRCPICSKSIVNMEMQFQRLEQSIESQPMPPEFQDTKAWVYCNDCNAKSSVKYHWLGLKCGVCDSYNTAQLQMIRGANQRSVPNENAGMPSSAQQRGRALDITAQAQRATNSAPPSAAVPNTPASPWRPSESQDPQTTHQSAPPVAVTDEYQGSTEALSDEDVDFWGLESPNSRGVRVLQGESTDDDDDDDDDSEDEDDSQDDATPIDEGWDVAGEAGEDDEEEDEMEIPGHR
ncbi:MAG: hypothetical protein Q9182_003704 [Xanthomendoza sp. 2 TL-2023]